MLLWRRRPLSFCYAATLLAWYFFLGLLHLHACFASNPKKPHFRPAAKLALVERWADLRAVAAQRAYASSLLDFQSAGEANGDETLFDLPELPAYARGELRVWASRPSTRPL